MTLGIALASLAFSPPCGSKLAQPPKGLAELALPVLAAGVLAVGAPVAAFAADAAAGQQIFDGNCAACHAGGQNVIVPEKTLELVARVIEQQHRRSAIYLLTISASMPPVMSKGAALLGKLGLLERTIGKLQATSHKLLE